MADATIQAATDADIPATDEGQDELLEAELLVEDVSIDGMCGVY
ncbi:MAG TPA: mycofactocin precursor MftA [Acidimicrobiales bacterium]|jgi:mycofactocin precursor|nr:mycofactocin precursor MftA [Acidimicrobiales bacterium]